MEERLEFLKKLSGLVEIAKKQGNSITIDEVKDFFEKIELNEEQMELVFDYLLSQKVVVKGYIKMSEAKEDKELILTEEESAYLKEYLQDLNAFKDVPEETKNTLYAKVLQGDLEAKNRLVEIYLKEVVDIAKEMDRNDIFIGDLIQEGNVGLIIGMDMLTDVETAHQTIVAQIKQSMQMLIEEQTELDRRDQKMIEQVSRLDEGIKTLTEELGRKVSIDELAIYMGMTEDEIEDILKLTGEETEQEEEA